MLNDKLIRGEIQKLEQKAHSSSFKCFFPNCNQKAIDSHILQRNGILTELTSDGHLYRLKKTDLFSDKCSLKRIGLTKVFTFPLFCKVHDDAIFKLIEKDKFDINCYIIQLLFSYRTLIAELRMKEINVNFIESVATSNKIRLLAPNIN